LSTFAFSTAVPAVAVAAALLLPGSHVWAAEAEFEPMFNGRDLEGWVVEGWRGYPREQTEAPIWVVEEGMLVCKGRRWGFLRYARELADFVVRLEYRMSDDCNSGLGIRGAKFRGNNWLTAPSWTGYEMQILDDAGKPPTAYSTGALYRYVAPRVNAARPAGQWNTIELQCQGPRIRITLNGKRIQDFDQRTRQTTEDKPLSGYFSLQDHGYRIEFRNLRLRELGR
jgi:hypothetical protein